MTGLITPPPPPRSRRQAWAYRPPRPLTAGMLALVASLSGPAGRHYGRRGWLRRHADRVVPAAIVAFGLACIALLVLDALLFQRVTGA